MYRRFILLIIFMFAPFSVQAGTSAPKELKDLYFGEALYYAFQGDWFDAISRLDTELAQHHGLDEPERDTLHYHINQAEFDVGDFELAYRMHQRAGRAITAVIEGNVEEPVRNEAIFRLARIYFQKNQPVNALYALERIKGVVSLKIRDDLAFLRAQILMANGRFGEAAHILRDLQDTESLEGFSNIILGSLIRKVPDVNVHSFSSSSRERAPRVYLALRRNYREQREVGNPTVLLLIQCISRYGSKSFP